MRHLVGLLVSLGVAGVCLIPASTLAQTPKAEVPDTDAPFKPAPVARRVRDLDYFIGLYDRIYRPYFLSRYHFIQRVCHPTTEQSKAIAKEGERALQSAVREASKKIQAATMAGKSAAEQRTFVDELHDTVRDQLATIAGTYLTPEQSKCLKVEEAERIAEWRKLEIERVLDIIDMELILGEKQRDEIRSALTSQWQESWVPDPDVLFDCKRRLPPIPDDYVAQFLTENQRKSWNDMEKGPPIIRLSGSGRALSRLRDDRSLEDDAAREAREAAIQAQDPDRVKLPKEVGK